jgi:hypothetical protein
LVPFDTTLYHFLPFQTTFITTCSSTTYKKIPKKASFFAQKLTL